MFEAQLKENPDLREKFNKLIEAATALTLADPPSENPASDQQLKTILSKRATYSSASDLQQPDKKRKLSQSSHCEDAGDIFSTSPPSNPYYDAAASEKNVEAAASPSRKLRQCDFSGKNDEMDTTSDITDGMKKIGIEQLKPQSILDTIKANFRELSVPPRQAVPQAKRTARTIIIDALLCDDSAVSIEQRMEELSTETEQAVNEAHKALTNIEGPFADPHLQRKDLLKETQQMLLRTFKEHRIRAGKSKQSIF